MSEVAESVDAGDRGEVELVGAVLEVGHRVGPSPSSKTKSSAPPPPVSDVVQRAAVEVSAPELPMRDRRIPVVYWRGVAGAVGAGAAGQRQVLDIRGEREADRALHRVGAAIRPLP